MMKAILFAPLVLLLVSSLLGEPGLERAAGFDVEHIEMPDQGHAGEPTLSHDAEGRLVATWIERHDEEARLMMARLTSGAWDSPRMLARGTNWFVNWADVPSAVFHPDGAVMAYWLERLGEGRYAYGVRFIVSADGNEWTEPAWLHEDRSPTEHGFVTAVRHEDGFMAVWLDGNGYATDRREMSVHARAIAVDGSLGEERSVDARTCDCCPTELVDLGDGRLATIYRDRSETEIRDMSVSIFDGTQWSEPTSLHDDGWNINACPVNGPSADVAGDRVAASWFTMATGSPEVYAGFLDGPSLSSSSPARIDLGRPAGRVALRMKSPDEALVLWMEGGDSDKAGLYVRTLTIDGGLGEPMKLADTSTGRAVGYPRLAREGTVWIAVWTQPASDEGEQARLRGVRFTL